MPSPSTRSHAGAAASALNFPWLLVAYAGGALTSPHLRGAELSDDYHERSRVQGWRDLHDAG